MVYKSFTLAI